MFNSDKIKAVLYEIIETVVVVTVLVIAIRFFIGEPRWIPSASMRATLLEGDRVFIEKLTHFYSKPERGDILVFYPPFEALAGNPWAIFTRLVGFGSKDVAYIKRVIGTPGDTIEIKNDKKTKSSSVYINGKKLKETYLYEPKMDLCTENMYCGPIKIPTDKYFMMGDNRNNSQDSRYWGMLPQDRVIGRAKFIFWPINRVKVLNAPEYKITVK